MRRYAIMLVVTVAVLGGSTMGPASIHAQCPPCTPPPVVILGAPVPVATPFAGARYSFHQPGTISSSFFAPAYNAPRLYTPRHLNPGPYYYTPTYSYTPGYYSYYYTPGFFRY